MAPVGRRWARLGPKNAATLFHTPEEGVCISAFVVARRGSGILMGRPRASHAWPERGGYPRPRAKDLEDDGSWILPATHLKMEESPDAAARRIVREWAGLRGTPRFVEVQSHVRRDPRAKSGHWDLCFVYELRPSGRPSPRPWWSEMRYIPPSEIRRLKVGRGHRDVLEEGGYLARRRT